MIGLTGSETSIRSIIFWEFLIIKNFENFYENS